MKKSDIIRALRDPEFRAGLSDADRALLPAHSSGLIELNENELSEALGGYYGDDLPPITRPPQQPGTSIRSASCRDYCCA